MRQEEDGKVEDDALKTVVSELFTANVGKVEQALQRPSLRGWFFGKTMQAVAGRADPELVRNLIGIEFEARQKEGLAA